MHLENNRIIKNASWIIACKIGQSVLSLIVTMLTARYLGPSNYGIINYAAAIVAFVAPIVGMGFGNILVIELVEKPDNEGGVVGTALVSSLFVAIFGIIGTISFSMITNINETETVIVCSLYSVVLLFQGAELIQYWFQKKYLSKYYSIISLVAFAVTSAYKVFLLATGKSIYWFAISNSIDYALILLVATIVYKKLGGQKLSFSLTSAKQMFSRSKHYILSNMMIVIFTQTDRIMLKMMAGVTATGYYSAAATCAGMFNFVFAAIIDSGRPTIFENLKKSRNRFEHSVESLYSVVIYSTLLLSLAITIFATPIIHIIYGSQYDPAINALRIAAWFLPFSFIGSVRNVWILATSNQKWLPFINLSGSLANVILNLILIPFWGIYGAAIASLATQFFANIVISYLIKAIQRSSKLMLKGLNPRFAIKEAKKLLGKG